LNKVFREEKKREKRHCPSRKKGKKKKKRKKTDKPFSLGEFGKKGGEKGMHNTCPPSTLPSKETPYKTGDTLKKGKRKKEPFFPLPRKEKGKKKKRPLFIEP